jgi:hypothetical protein
VPHAIEATDPQTGLCVGFRCFNGPPSRVEVLESGVALVVDANGWNGLYSPDKPGAVFCTSQKAAEDSLALLLSRGEGRSA